MYILLDSKWKALIGGWTETDIIHAYADQLLIKTSHPLNDIPADNYEVLDDENVTIHGVPLNIPAGQFELEDAPHTIVRFAGPVAAEWRTALEKANVKVLFWCPRFGACVRLPPEMDSQVLKLAFPFILGAKSYLQEQCSRDLPAQKQAERQSAGIPEHLLDIVCFSREDRVGVEQELRKREIKILATSSSKIRVSYQGDPSLLRDLVGVKVVDAARGVVTLSATTQSVLGLTTANGEWQSTYTGKGQVVAVADTGLDRGSKGDDLHADFRGRVLDLSSWPINESWSTYVKTPGGNDNAADLNTSHGTHVAGLALGDGTLSGGIHRGVAPEAELVFQSIEQYTDVKREYSQQMASGYYLSGRPLDLRELFQAARNLGARIHINAWGDPARGHYTNDSYETDLFLNQNQDAVILFAAGNDGVDRDGDGTPDQGSLYAPASAKNVITVGASSGCSSGVGLRGTWGDLDPKQERYRGSARLVPISGEPDRIALCSSTGPTSDGRIKPDVCAPGTNLVGPRSTVSRLQGWGFASPMPYYMYDGGSSMATAVAGGFATLLRQAWQERRNGIAPSGAALKALMVLGAKPVLSRRDGKAESSVVAGFGILNFTGSSSQIDLSVNLFDERERGLTTGETRAYPIEILQQGNFRAVLTWYDAPGETLVNDLNLCLVDSQEQKIWGNHPRGGPGAPDHVNNVEVIEVPDLTPGSYKLLVIGVNVPESPQNFAVAISSSGLQDSAPISQRLDLDLGVASLRGIGSILAGQLASRGITQLRPLLRLSEAELGEALGVNGVCLARLRSRLILLNQTINQPRPAMLSPATTLADVERSAPPTTVSADQWNRARQSLLPLTLVFKHQLLTQITLNQVFGN
ncbi:MAG TPA: S8 family serine peptidase [Pyrinomonadaceae bacterium]|nr:S8 family serine peptidase [Pyrinomonadaceae bacterium]